MLARKTARIAGTQPRCRASTFGKGLTDAPFETQLMVDQARIVQAQILTLSYLGKLGSSRRALSGLQKVFGVGLKPVETQHSSVFHLVFPVIAKIVLSTAIVTRVPAGATSGMIEVVTPDGTLSSKLP